MISFCLWPALRAALLGAVLVMVSLPLVFAVHAHFELGAPPSNGLWALGLSLIAIFVGAAWIGLFVGCSRASGTLAALFGGAWGIALTLLLASSYSQMVSRPAFQQATELNEQNRQRIEQSSHETPEQARAGHASKDAALSGARFSEDARDATIGGTAKLPAMLLLMWTILIPPALSAFECRRARSAT